MKKLVLGLSSIMLIVAIIASLWFLLTKQKINFITPPDNKKITIAASIFPLVDIAQNIGGENVQVIQLLPAGATPHSYTLTPQQLASIQNAKALFVIGHKLDDWAVKAATQGTKIPIITVDNNIQLRAFDDEHEHEDEHDEIDAVEDHYDHQHEAGSIDPHYWLTTPNAQEIAKTVATTLEQLDPDHRDGYQSNLQNYLAELNKLETELQALIRQANHRDFIAMHDGWSYLADHYCLNLVATYEPVEGKTPSINDIQELQNIVREHDIHTFFTEPQKRSTSATQLLQNDLGLKIEVLDPIGGVKGRESYINMMRENIAAIVK